jgi:alkylation response protein AidB-like acyl-CoA dehydrogenase
MVLGLAAVVFFIALDTGRLGIAACAVGLADAALKTAAGYAKRCRQYGRPIADFQGIGFMLGDMATAIEAGRCLYRDAANRRDRGEDVTKLAAMAKLFCTDTAMTVTTNAVQILGGIGYTSRCPAERYMREAKVLQIFEGTNQIQRLIISRSLQNQHAERQSAPGEGTRELLPGHP